MLVFSKADQYIPTNKGETAFSLVKDSKIKNKVYIFGKLHPFDYLTKPYLLNLPNHYLNISIFVFLHICVCVPTYYIVLRCNIYLTLLGLELNDELIQNVYFYFLLLEFSLYIYLFFSNPGVSENKINTSLLSLVENNVDINSYCPHCMVNVCVCYIR